MISSSKLSLVVSHPVPSVPLACELHIRRRVRERYGLDETLFSYSGSALFADVQAARRVAHKLNQSKERARDPQQAVSAADLHAIGLMDEITHHVIAVYRQHNGETVLSEARRHLEEVLGPGEVETLLTEFVREFPPRSVHQGELSPEEYLQQDVGGVSGADRALEELLVMWMENQNPAFEHYAELFDDSELAANAPYREAIEALHEFFRGKPTIPEAGPDENLIDALLQPVRLHPDSLEEQLAYVRTRWDRYLGTYLFRVLRGIDLIREEHKPVFGGPGPTQVYEYSGEDHTPRFSPDLDWMPHVVMIAKSALVWLDQLSRFYGREIKTLADIPTEELDRLARSGFNALWLIGIWRRSPASQRIKKLCGNPEAEASAYSLLDYEISERVGGWEALEELRYRCNQRGIRLASDMVPNHTGLDSAWVHDHPDWFLQLDYPPFPGYTFEGENLSGRPNFGIYLEDHYYSRSDAAVVFKRVDQESGDTRYIYHGNDGTGMPWNDTAQLNFLNPETREAVIQLILHVARNFPIIRFDAAMTLAKKHYRRLWFPEPGSGGDIPSRAEFSMTDAEFEKAMPQEFWREVVDRVAQEAPNTLLLAEAFWMMESYFVRSLGMHRVYNSAFMNMLKNEENDKYRQTIKNTLEFDKNILKRFVNFMNNPDEDTAVAQFGKGDKYFAVCTLMVTMPGLPMFGHGQIEGFEEKYGMEYGRAYWHESPDPDLVRRHEREIFPLMQLRYVFSEVESFLLYDLFGEDGRVNENVFAYSNAAYGKRCLVVVNNAIDRCWGWLRGSSPYVEEDERGKKRSRDHHVAEALGLNNDFKHFCIFREQRSGLWFIRNSGELYEQGLFVALDGYETQVYLDIHEVVDSDRAYYAQLADHLAGAGVESIDRAMRELYLRPLHAGFAGIANSSVTYSVRAAVSGESAETPIDPEEVTESYARFLSTAEPFLSGPADRESAIREFYRLFSAVCELRHLDLLHSGQEHRQALGVLTAPLKQRPNAADALTVYAFVRPIEQLSVSEAGQSSPDDDGNHTAAACLEEWLLLGRLDEVIVPHYEASEDEFARRKRLELLIAYDRWAARLLQGVEAPLQSLRRLTEIPEIRAYLGVNTHEGVEWFHKERFENLCYWLYVIAVVRMRGDPASDVELVDGIARLYRAYGTWRDAAARSEYRLDKLLDPPPADTDSTPSAGGTSATSGGTAGGGAGKGGPGQGGSSGSAGRGKSDRGSSD